MNAMTNFIGAPPITFGWETDYKTGKLKFRFLQELKLMHSCTETHTYVLDLTVLNGGNEFLLLSNSNVDLLWDLDRLQNAPVPFGQIVFLSYHKNGEFYLEAATDKFKPSLVEQAFQSFGYTDAKINGEFVHVSEKDTFKLKLKYGI